MAGFVRPERFSKNSKLGMAYVVRVTTHATRDLALIFEAIHGESSEAAFKWYLGLKEAIFSLEGQPNRCSQTPEDAKLRFLLYGCTRRVYRVIYRVTEKRANAWTCCTSGTALVSNS